jgi:arabinofuranosyltransferase
MVPNSALAKEAGRAHWSQGWLYARDFFGTYVLWLPISLLMLHWGKRLRIAAATQDVARATLWATPVVCGALHVGYITRLGGDFMHARLLLPGAFAILLPVSVTYVAQSRPRRWIGQPCMWMLAIIIAWSMVCGMSLRVPYEGGIAATGIADERGFYTRLSGIRHPISAEDYSRTGFAEQGHALRRIAESLAASSANPRRDRAAGRRIVIIDLADDPALGALPPRMNQVLPLSKDVAPPIDLVAIRWSIGLCGFLAGPRVHLVDRRGLTDPIASRLRLKERGRPGHEKVFKNEWVIARFAAPDAPATPGERIEAARRALACGHLAELNLAVREPLTRRRFAQNVVFAWKSRALRIPPDPREAMARFCSDHSGGPNTMRTPSHGKSVPDFSGTDS